MLYTPEVVALSSKNDKTPEFDPSKFEDAAKWVYEQKGYNAKMLEQEPARALITETANVFNTALDNGISTNAIPAAMEQKLREDVYLFSAFKTHQELGEVSSMLRTEKGGVKPFEQFLTDVKRINKDYNENYLRAEYHFAVSSAQMAAKWAEFEDDGDRYNLQYRTASDERVRDAHAALHNTTLPIDDPFWDKYFAPNGWGCRCNVVRVRKSKYKESDSEKALELGLAATRQMSGKIDKGAIFRFNPGKSKQVFPPKHPYYKTAQPDNAEIRKQAEKAHLKEQRKSVTNWAKANLIDKQVKHKKIEGKIGFNMTGIKEIINQPHEQYSLKIEALKDITNIIPKAKYLRFAKSDKLNPMVAGYHYLEFEIGDKAAYLTIREYSYGVKVLYAITDKIRVT